MFARLFISILLTAFVHTTAMSQQYEVTEYQGFGVAEGNGFGTAPPNTLDSNVSGYSDSTSMSPDSWSAPSFPQAEMIMESPAWVGGTSITSSPDNQSLFPATADNLYGAIINAEPVLNGPQTNGPQTKSDSPFRSASYAVTKTSESLGNPTNSPQIGTSNNGRGYSVYPLYKSDESNLTNNVFESSSITGQGYSNGQFVPAPHQRVLPKPPPRVQGNSMQGFQQTGYSNPITNGMSNYGSGMGSAQFRPDLGQRAPGATVRHHGSYDDGKKFDFEDKKKEYPPMGEILKTGRYFASASMLYVRPHFQNNTAITTNSSTFGESTVFDYDYEVAPYLRFGFESKYGPGIEFDYLQFDEASNPASITTSAGVTAVVGGPERLTSFATSNPGETLTAEHSIDVETFGVSFFKEVKLPISRINGRFGFQYTSVAHQLDATLTDGSGTIGTLQTRSDLRAFGPKFTLEYYRPVGHTKFEFLTSVGGSAMFGERDQFVENSLSEDFSRIGADEFLTLLEFNSGIQYKRNFAENRSVFARLGTTYSIWNGGGTGTDPQGDFGLRGFSFGVGYNR